MSSTIEKSSDISKIPLESMQNMDEKSKCNDIAHFEAKTRYLASSVIVTIPVKIVRELNLYPRTEVQIYLVKNHDKNLINSKEIKREDKSENTVVQKEKR